MSLSDWALLAHFILEGIQAIKKFIIDEQVRSAFSGLKEAQTDEDREKCAKNIASLIYGAN